MPAGGARERLLWPGHLLEVGEMPSIEGLRVPEAFYTVIDAPARLAGMVEPTERTPWARIAAAGIRYVVCLTDDEPRYDPAPVEPLSAVALEDLYGGIHPSDPEREAGRIVAAADRVVEALTREDGVVVHCIGGTGRTGTVIGTVLRRLGHSTDELRAYLGRLHRRRRSRWPESAWAAELLSRIEPLA